MKIWSDKHRLEKKKKKKKNNQQNSWPHFLIKKTTFSNFEQYLSIFNKEKTVNEEFKTEGFLPEKYPPKISFWVKM